MEFLAITNCNKQHGQALFFEKTKDKETLEIKITIKGFS